MLPSSRLLGFILVSGLCSCHSEPKIKIHPPLDEPPVSMQVDTIFQKGTIHHSVSCLAKPSVSYSLFIPNSISEDENSLLVVFADPHGDGSFPLDKYEGVAEELQLVFAGSNQSRNGNAVNENASFLYEIMDDAEKRFRIIKNKISACGFSGGARTVSWTANNSNRLAAVIAIGGSMPEAAKAASARYYYLALGGDQDFNAREMEEQQPLLDRTGIKNDFFVFNGKHEWPDESIMKLALLSIKLGMMQQKVIPFDNSAIEKFRKLTDSLSGVFIKQEQIIESYFLNHYAANILEGLLPGNPFRSFTDSLAKTKTWSEASRQRGALLLKEKILSEQYTPLIIQRDSNWWKDEMKNLNGKIKSSSSRAEKNMYIKICGYLSLAAYMNANANLNRDNRDALRFATVYSIIDPVNPEPFYMLARLAARNGNTGQALQFLKKSESLGFKDSARIVNEPDFTAMFTNGSLHQQGLQK